MRDRRGLWGVGFTALRLFWAIDITTRWRSRLPGKSQSESFGRFELFECLTAGSYERERVEFRLGSGDLASSASDSPVSAVRSPFIRSTLFAPPRSVCTAETTPARRENPAASLFLIHRSGESSETET